VFALLDVRVEIVAYARAEPGRIRVEGTVWDDLAECLPAADGDPG
jgi:membrane protein implicated in regulation of membrane protease activity